MIDVLIDTSVFRQDPYRRKAAFGALERVAETGQLKVHVPFFVEKELLSCLESEPTGSIEQICRSLVHLTRQPLLRGLKSQLTDLDNKVKQLRADVETCVREDLERWFKRINAERYPVADHHGANVAEAYFSGEPPFSERKNRKDIPDAFIFETIKDLAGGIKDLHVVVADKGLAGACSKVKGVTVHTSLDDFIKSENCLQLIRNQDFEDQLEKIVEELKVHKTTLEKKLASCLENEFSMHEFKDEHIPSDGNEAYIEGIESDPTDIDFDFDKIEYMGYGTILVSFSCKVDCLVNFHMFKNDYHCLSDDRMESISVSEYDNRHYYEAQESLPISVTGSISITFDLDTLPQGETVLSNFKVNLDEAEERLDSIDYVSVDDEIGRC